jgi:hypothetical protein
MARFWRLLPARFHQPPFKPCLRFSRTRLNDGLLDVACMLWNYPNGAAFHRCVRPVVTAFAKPCVQPTHLAHIHSRISKLSRFYRGVIGRRRHALTLTSQPTRPKQGPFPPARFATRLPRYYEPLGLPPSSARLQPSGLIRPVFARLGCQVGSLLFRIALSQRATA